jgi:hypothetical protein
MSERTFRAVVAAVLVGALVLAVVVAFAVLQPPAPSSSPTATPTAQPTPTAPPTPAPTPTPTPQLVFGEVDVTAVGSVPRGGSSGTNLVLRFVESSVDAIPDAEGSFTVTLTDAGGAGGTLVVYTGTPVVDAPGSLGASAEIVGPGVLRIGAAAEAALGPIGATLGDFGGSLAGGVANVVLPSPGTVVAGP